jgi:hypothetical protein
LPFFHIFHIISHLSLLFFHIFHIISLFSSILSLSFHYSTYFLPNHFTIQFIFLPYF